MKAGTSEGTSRAARWWQDLLGGCQVVSKAGDTGVPGAAKSRVRRVSLELVSGRVSYVDKA